MVKLKSSLRKFYSPHHDLVDRYGITCVTNDHGYVPLFVSTSRSFHHWRLITGFVTRLTRRAPPMEQELLTLPEHMRSPPVFLVEFVLLVLRVCFEDRCLTNCTFSFSHCFLCSRILNTPLVSSNSSYHLRKQFCLIQSDCVQNCNFYSENNMALYSWREHVNKQVWLCR